MRADSDTGSTMPGGGITRRALLAGALATGAGAAGIATARTATAEETDPPGRSWSVISPGGRLHARLAWGPAGLTWAVNLHRRPVLLPSTLGLRLDSGAVLGPGATLTGFRRDRIHGHWTPAYGRRERLTEECAELQVDLVDPATNTAFSVILRAYDDGVALRYLLRNAPGDAVTIAGEQTRFRFPTGAVLWASRDESDYSAVSPGAIPVSSNGAGDNGSLADIPVTVRLADGGTACIAESAREHYPRLLLASVPDDADAVVSYLATSAQRGGGPIQSSFSVATPFATPWRTLIVGGSAADLVDRGDLVTTLARPSVLADTSWIKPGKAFRCNLTTAEGLAGVDFAAARGLQYVEFDAGWYGPENSPSSDATKPIPALDLGQIIEYGRSHGIGVILYVNRIAAERQLDQIAPLYQQWGVAGVKFGFLLEGTQAQNDWILNSIRTFGEHKLLVNTHDDLRPAGLERTLPNYITMEGVRGNEHFPTATHNVTLPFTRNVAGPMDYTICYAQSRDQTTNAHQLAMAAVYYSALEWIYWYAKPSQFATGYPELSWFDAVPTTWQESRTLSGEIGEHVVVARRNGGTWFLGAMTNEQARTVEVGTDFLEHGEWQAHVYADGAPGSAPRGTPVVLSERTVRAGDALRLDLAPSGGQAIRFERR
ncbi:glycoside hydrolase family 97 catalytic domain-containing protein [Actinoallomurus sp. CA-150999]|uniref:glycoside hydrolase family 97 protein n=1 Tax=Actinoallomurus sp. CA-150999 TaxID=3239887 RepID=UPI003D8C387B